MQNNLLKYVMRFDIRTGTNLLHTALDIMKVENIHKNIVLTFVNMCLMGVAVFAVFALYVWENNIKPIWIE